MVVLIQNRKDQRGDAVCNDGGVARAEVDTETSPDDLDLQTKLLHSRLGRVAIGIVMVLGIVWVLLPNLPESGVRDDIASVWKPAEQIGLVQDWAVFSPNPRSQSIDVRARIAFDDGSIDFWDVPDFDPAIGALRQYRWHKWQERLRLDDHEVYWLPTAEWIADHNARDGVRPLRVTLIRRWIDHEPLTAAGPTINHGWNQFEFYEWERDT